MSIPAAPSEPSTPLSLPRAIAAVAIGIAAGLLVVVVPYALILLTSGRAGASILSPASFGASLTMLFPIVQGFAMAFALGPQRRKIVVTTLLSVALVVVELIGAAVVLREGVICLIILSPLLVSFVAGGAVLGRFAARRFTGVRLQASLAPLIVLAVFAEATGPTPDYSNAVVDTVVIDAPADYVWRYVVQYPENQTEPEYWLWRIGLPTPVQSVASAQQVGAARECRFTDGIIFEERITELAPNRLIAFDVTRQPDHPEVVGHFQLDRGQMLLTQNPDGTTTITATSWYHLYVRPAAYFDWWTADIVRQVHFRVLNHIKRLAERDYHATAS